MTRVWPVPVALAALGLLGLVVALLGDGLRDWLSWIALALPLLAVAWAWRRRR